MTTDEIRRRAFLARTGQFIAFTLASSDWAFGQAPASKNPFTLGVASGDPEPDGVVLWTRLAPDPVNGGGMPPERVDVDWQVATDEKMSRIIKRGRFTATPDLAHSVHVEVNGLEPGRWYYYRFTTGRHESPIGRTRTAPDPKKTTDKLNFAFASCQNFEIGHFTAYQHMLADDLDLVVHLGDYIYEGSARPGRVRMHDGPEPMTLSAYRNRHAIYRTDPDLQKAHANFPWIVTWDDHELENNYAGDISEDNAPRSQFLERRASAYQAYYEHMPLRRSSMPKGSSMTLYRRVGFGALAEFSVLDTRQYRSDQPCGDGTKVGCVAATLPSQTMLGPEQEQWFLNGLARSKAKWNIVANQVMMAYLDHRVGSEVGLSMDKWDGYQVARDRVIKFMHEQRVSNPVVITGDIHSNWVADLKLNWTDPKSKAIATEFVGTSITSGGDGFDMNPRVAEYLPENPHVSFFNGQRGYVRCSVNKDKFQADYRVLEYVTKPNSPVSTRASFIVEDGHPGAKRA